MSSSSSCGELRSLLQPRASLIWILFKSAIPLFFVGFPWKVILSLKAINTGSFKITFALLKEDAERRFLPVDPFKYSARSKTLGWMIHYLTTTVMHELWCYLKKEKCFHIMENKEIVQYSLWYLGLKLHHTDNHVCSVCMLYLHSNRD